VSDPRLPAELTHTAAAIPFAIGAGIVVIGACLDLFAGRRAGPALAEHIKLGLEFLLAAGLLRLASADQLEMLGLVAAVILARRIIVLGVRFGARAWQ
jgi:uncharacterized protein DUF1622